MTRRSPAAWKIGALVVLAALAAATAPSSSPAPAKPLPLGASFTFRQPPDAVKAIVLRVVDPVRSSAAQPRSGRRLVAVKVSLRNVGSRILAVGSADCTRFKAAVLIDGRGGRRPPRRGLDPDLAAFFAAKSNPYVETGALAPGRTAVGYYTFEVPASIRPSLFTLTPCRAAGSARWRLR